MLIPGPKDLVENIIKELFGVQDNVPWWVGLILVLIGILVLVLFYWRRADWAQAFSANSEPIAPSQDSKGESKSPNIAFKIRSPQRQWTYRLKIGSQIRIGRDPSNDLVIPVDLTVSRFHCVAHVFSDYVHVEDLGATNILAINGIEMHKGDVRMRDNLELGETSLILIPDIGG
jgi:FHA domain